MNQKRLLLVVLVISIIALVVYLKFSNNKLYSPKIDPPAPLPCGCEYNGVVYISGDYSSSEFYPPISSAGVGSTLSSNIYTPHTIIVIGCEGTICQIDKLCKITVGKTPFDPTSQSNINLEGKCNFKI